MNDSQLTTLRDRLAARLDDDALTRYQLLDIATILMFVHWNFHHGLVDQGSTRIEPEHIDAFDTSLFWIRDHANEAPNVELRARVAAALDAVTHIVGCASLHPSYLASHLSIQEGTHA